MRLKIKGIPILLLFLNIACTNVQFKKENISIISGLNVSKQTTQAAEILHAYLGKMYSSAHFNAESRLVSGNAIYLINLKEGVSDEIESDLQGIELPTKPESFVIRGKEIDGKNIAYIIGSDERGLFYGVYELLEILGCRFFLSEEFVPQKEGRIQLNKWNYTNTPLIEKRIVFNWHNFLSGCSAWDFPEYKNWIDAAQKMKYNSIMVHAYGNNPMYRFSLNGVNKPSGYIPNTQRGRDWGTNHVNDIRNLYGGEIFDKAVFGSAASQTPESEVEETAVSLMQEVFTYAEQRSMEIIFGFDINTVSSNPQNVLNTIPEKDRLYNSHKQILPNPETGDGYKYFKSHITGLLKDYPNVNYLVPWVRYMQIPKGKDYFYVETFPAVWEKEYQIIIEENKDLEKDYASRSFFYVGKIIIAYQKVLLEIGRSDVKLGLGTWNWVSFPYLDKFLPEDIEFFPIDWDLNFETQYALETLNRIHDERKVYPIVWAHHDDHSYIGRPFTPPSTMVEKLNERQAEGFGILHWTTFPLDMYFKNLSAQVWQKTTNENYDITIQDYAVNAIRSGSDIFNDYLKRFYLEAPHFARETSDNFYDILLNEHGKTLFPLYNPDSIIEGSNSRLLILNELKLKQSSVSNTKAFNYYRCMEEFFILFFENEKLLIESAGLCMEGKPNEASDIIKRALPEKAILKYVEAIKYGPGTVGEEAIILSLNLRWLPDFIDIKQKTGLLPVEYTFYPTSHEHLAQGAGIYSYLADNKQNISVCLGDKETNGAQVSDENGGELLLGSDPVEFTVGYWRKVPNNYFSDTWKDNRLFPGKYLLKLHINGQSDNNVIPSIYVSLKNDLNDILNSQKTFEKPNSTVVVPFEIDHSLLHLSLKLTGSEISISGFSIESVN